MNKSEVKMNDLTHFKHYNVILIRYSGEIWLKSKKVKIRMLKILMNNVKNMLIRSEILVHKYQLSQDSARIFFFFNNEDIPKAVDVLRNVFGIYSFSPALRTSCKLNNIIKKAIIIGEIILQKGDTFALRVKRSGKHEYSSIEVATKVGQAILDYFTDLCLKVDLTSPQKKIYIEIRGDFSYIFTDIVKSKWGGLPIEKRKKILIMDVGRLTDLLSGFMLMKRGCDIYPILFNLLEEDNSFNVRLLNWKELVNYTPYFKFNALKVDLFKILGQLSQELKEQKYFCAICRLIRFEILSKILKELKIEGFEKIRAISDGANLNLLTSCPDEIDLESIALNFMFSENPIFTPLIGLNSKKIEQFLLKISSNLNTINYCRFKPKNQEINIEELKKIYKSLNLKHLIEESLISIKEIKIIS